MQLSPFKQCWKRYLQAHKIFTTVNAEFSELKEILHKSKPSVSLMKAKTSETRKFEFLIAKKNKKESIHYKKWENMLL